MSTMEKQDTPRIRRSFPDEFKADAVAMVLDDGRKIVDVAEAKVVTFVRSGLAEHPGRQ